MAHENLIADLSPSSRRAWIEIQSSAWRNVRRVVALLAEGVDRNSGSGGGVIAADRVALLAEGVDRNCTKSMILAKMALSPSSRRAWIEMWKPMC